MSNPNTAAMRLQRLVVGSAQTNCYILVCARTLESIILDPGEEADKILAAVKPTKPRYLLFTHGHSDHTGALEELQWRLNLPIGIHPADAGQIPMAPDLTLDDDASIQFGEVVLQVMHIPGHTPGSVGLFSEGRLLSGDTVFPGGPGRTGSPEDFINIVASIRDRILVLPDATKVLPGHGIGNTVGRVRQEFSAFTNRPDTEGLWGDVTWKT
jgi:hydroxyacylglutathione hydrolase